MTKLLSKRQVLERVPVSSATLARWEKQGLFPRRFHIGGNGVWKKAFWREDEVADWIEAHAERRDTLTDGS
jgi:predicted DNA-binding transcriptional regulator AlpA